MIFIDPETLMSLAQVWQITSNTDKEVHLQDQSSLDTITRQLANGYYSTFRTFDGCRRVLGLEAHLRRLYEPVPAPEIDSLSLRRKLRALLQPYRPGEARVRLIMTRRGKAYVVIEPLQPLRREIYEDGVRVETTELQRHRPRLKATSFIGRSESERKHILQTGIFEALLVKDGKILEGMTSNFFYVSRNSVLCTAGDDILLGVTRETVLEIARGRGLEIKYLPLARDQVEAVLEAFITSSSRGIVPVVQIDNVTVGQGSPGEITSELMTRYDAYVLVRAEVL